MRQIAEKHENGIDIRRNLGVISFEWKIEKRVLGRISHIMRLGNERITQAVVLGWWEKLKGKKEMVKGGKR